MISSLSQPLNNSETGESYLKIQLDSQHQALFPMTYAQEVLVINTQKVTSIPNIPPHVIGLVNQRNRIHWLVDLSILLGLSSQAQKIREYNVALIEFQDIAVGLVVEQIKGVIKILIDDIRSPIEEVSPQMLPYLKGCVFNNDQSIYVLDPSAFVESKLFNQ